MPKVWYKSKTLIFNALAVALLALQAGIGDVVPLEYQAVAVAVINYALRWLTSQGVTVRRE